MRRELRSAAPPDSKPTIRVSPPPRSARRPTAPADASRESTCVTLRVVPCVLPALVREKPEPSSSPRTMDARISAASARVLPLSGRLGGRLTSPREARANAVEKPFQSGSIGGGRIGPEFFCGGSIRGAARVCRPCEKPVGSEPHVLLSQRVIQMPGERFGQRPAWKVDGRQHGLPRLGDCSLGKPVSPGETRQQQRLRLGQVQDGGARHVANQRALRTGICQNIGRGDGRTGAGQCTAAHASAAVQGRLDHLDHVLHRTAFLNTPDVRERETHVAPARRH